MPHDMYVDVAATTTIAVPRQSQTYRGADGTEVEVYFNSDGTVGFSVYNSNPDINALLNDGIIMTEIHAEFTRRAGRRGLGGGPTLADLAAILADLINRKFAAVMDQVSTLTEDSPPGDILLAQAQMQVLSILMNAFKTGLDSIGGAMAVAAQKGGAVG